MGDIPTGADTRAAINALGISDKVQKEGGHLMGTVIPWHSWRKLFNGSITLQEYKCMGFWFLHAYNEAYSRTGFDVAQGTCRNSVIGELFHKHMPGVLQYRC